MNEIPDWAKYRSLPIRFEILYDSLITINPKIKDYFNVYIWIREVDDLNDYIMTLNSGKFPNNMRQSLIVDTNLLLKGEIRTIIIKDLNLIINEGFNKKYERTLMKKHQEITYNFEIKEYPHDLNSKEVAILCGYLTRNAIYLNHKGAVSKGVNDNDVPKFDKKHIFGIRVDELFKNTSAESSVIFRHFLYLNNYLLDDVSNFQDSLKKVKVHLN